MLSRSQRNIIGLLAILLLTLSSPLAVAQAAKPFFSATVGISNLCYYGNVGGQDEEKVAVNVTWNGSYQIVRLTTYMDGIQVADQLVSAASSGSITISNGVFVTSGVNHSASVLFYVAKKKQGMGPYSSGPVLVTQLAPC